MCNLAAAPSGTTRQQCHNASNTQELSQLRCKNLIMEYVNERFGIMKKALMTYISSSLGASLYFVPQDGSLGGTGAGARRFADSGNIASARA